MKKSRKMTTPATPEQVRDYVLDMLEGLAVVAVSGRDLETRDRITAFARSLMDDWTARSTLLLRQEFGRIDELVAAYAVERPDSLAVVMGAAEVSYAQLQARIDRMAATLQRDGLKKGDVFALCAGTSIDYIALFLAASRTGIIVAPIATWLSAETIRLLLADSGAKLLFTDVAGLRLDTGLGAVRMSDLGSWLSPLGAKPQPVSIDADDIHYLMYSSGTTGVPKGIVQTYMSRWRGAVVLGVTPRASYLVSTPLYASSTIFAWGRPLAGGGTAVLMAKFDALEFLQLAETWRITDAVLVPVQCQRLLAHPRFDAFDLSAFRSKLVVSAPFDTELKAQMLRRWPGSLTELYGMSEGGAGCVLEAGANPDKLHTVGKPLPSCDLRVIDDEGLELPRGAIGEIVGRSRVMMKGYLNQPDATARVFWVDAEGQRYIRSGDIGRVDEDGFVELLGRKKDMIISGGQNVYPCDLEAVLQRHPDVQDVAVVGRASERWGEEPVAFVTLNPSAAPDVEAMLSWACGQLGKHQRPAEVIVLNELPRSPIGKILKTQLRGLAAEPVTRRDGRRFNHMA
jgi:long-chain acyl-CoA synthetase